MKTTNEILRIATRGSRLALWQAEWVQARLHDQGLRSELVLVETQGDRQMSAFSKMQGQGFFTKAVQDVVLEGAADIAVQRALALCDEVTNGGNFESRRS